MRSAPLGGSDVTVSAVGLGCNNFGRRIDLAAARAVVDAALDAGVTHFDTAESYGDGDSERILGELLAGRRDTATIATKFGWSPDGGQPGGAPSYVRAAVDRSLVRLQTDVIDLLYYHRPDGVTPIAETVGAMGELVAAGKVRAIACSNVDVDLLRAAEAASPTGVAAVQNQYSLLEREADADVLPACREDGVGFVPYFPLAGGLLTGKYARGAEAPAGARLTGRDDLLDDAHFDAVERLAAFARERGRTLHDLAIAALASTPGVASVIAGATRPEQVRANAAAAGWTLTPAELAAVPRVEGTGIRI